MGTWECPDCGRRFARTRQGHECAPAMTLEEYFSTGPEDVDDRVREWLTEAYFAAEG